MRGVRTRRVKKCEEGTEESTETPLPKTGATVATQAALIPTTTRHRREQRSLNVQRRRFLPAAFAAVLVSAGLAACGGGGDHPPLQQATISTLSNRADLVSGGDALVEVKLPADATASSLKVDLDGADITPTFATRADGRTVGLVTGLKNGANTITVSSANGTFQSAKLVVTNHPRGGPVLLGAQTTPWVCATPVPTAAVGNTPATNASGLSTAATDAQCNIATEYKLFYRTLTPVSVATGDGGCSFVLPDPSPTIANPTPSTPANSCFQPYVAGTTAAASVAPTTTSNGVTLPYIVRVERGTLNRGIYDIAVLFDPTAAAWTANSPQVQWNGKLLYSYGASTGQPRLQFRSEQPWQIGFGVGPWDDTALRLGFMIADNSLTDSLYNSNRTLTAETTMMMKEYIVDHYGELKFVMSNGCSGGSIGQNTVSSIYPGLLDGIQPSCDFPDSITTGIEVTDCVLLVNLYNKPEWQALMTGLTQADINAKKAAIEGHRDQTGCVGWTNSFGYNNQPGNFAPTFFDPTTGAVARVGATTNNCKLPAALVYDPVTNPGGTRCGDPDLATAVWGTVPNTAAGVPAGALRAQQTTDNTGVQYGLTALLAGTITAEEFVTLNEKVGGTDADSNPTAARSVADSGALDIAYRAGIVSSGKNLGKVAIIDSRGYDEGPGSTDIHYNWRSFEERARLDAEAGDHDNQVIWRYGTGLLPATPAQIAAVTTKSFTTMDTWLTTLMTQAPKAFVNDEHTHAQVVTAKPAAAVDLCFLTADVNFANPVTDQATCDADARLKYYASPRQAAGGPLAENILKCQLKPLVFSDYTGITFTGAQQARLNAVFPNGVCDWSKPGVGQQDPVGPLIYTAGPGGVPLPAMPTSTPI
jgi:hypothetical protein